MAILQIELSFVHIFEVVGKSGLGPPVSPSQCNQTRKPVEFSKGASNSLTVLPLK